MTRTNVRKLVVATFLTAGAGILISQAAAPATPQGYVIAKRYDNIGGTVVTDLTGNAKYPGSPSAVVYPQWLEYPFAADIGTTPPGDSGMNNYGVELQGYFYPDATKAYTFVMSADDGAQFWLSTDADPANKKLIATEPSWNNPRDYANTARRPNGENRSAPINLVQGRAYYFSALMKEGGGGDNISVTIDDVDAGGALPIPGSMLSPYGVATQSSITTQPVDAAVYAGGIATFSVGFDVPPPATLTSIKWQKNGADIPNSNAATLSFTTVVGDNGAKIKAIIVTSAGTLTSSEATLNVAEILNQFTAGIVKFEAYNDIGGGTAVADLLSSAKYPNSPDDSRLITAIDTPNGYGDNYGARVTGFIIPPETAEYNFFIRSDDASQFYLSSNETTPNPDLVAPDCEETGCCAAFMEPDTGDAATTQAPIALIKGRKYAFLALVKEGGGGDFLQVAARKVGDSTAAASLTPLSGAWIGANAKPSLGTPVITKQPVGNPQLIEGRTMTLSVDVVVNPTAYNFPAIIQWRKNGDPIPGANARTYTISNASAANSGSYDVVASAPSGQSAISDAAVVTVVPDTFPPAIAGAGAIASETGNTFDVGVSFDEPVTAASAGSQANYSLSAGTITGIKYYEGSPGVVLTVSGLTVGSTYTVTVVNVTDVKGNKLVSAAKQFKVSGLKWGVVGGKEVGLGNGILATAENGFDIYSDAIGQWGTYDESTFVYEQITGDFDKVLRVEFQDSSSQWARAGLIVRDKLNFGTDRATQEGGEAMRYQKVHVNPVVTAMGTAGNNSWEGNRRLATGAATTSAGGGGTPLYPNAWCRLQRVGDVFTIYRSDNGTTWTQLGSTTFASPDADPPVPPMPATVYVGPDFSPENGNIPADSGLRKVWLAKIREYGNYPPVVTTPTISISSAGVITYTGTLVSSPTVKGTYTEVSGAPAGGGTYTVPKTGSATFYQAK